MVKWIFLGTFLFAGIFQGIRWSQFCLFDGSMWAHQARYVQEKDAREFDAKVAYGHPGGPIIEGLIAIHILFGFSYETSLLILLTALNSLVIASISAMCYSLRPQYLWWLVIAGTLTLHMFYEYATPPSALVSPLLVLLSLMTLQIYERDVVTKLAFYMWALVAGLAISIRADIGIVFVFAYMFILWSKVSWKKILLLSFFTFLFFVITDPFMWFRPVQHLYDIVSKVLYHYSEFPLAHMPLFNVFSVSSLMYVSILLSLLPMLSLGKIAYVVAPKFLYILIITTVALYTIFLTARYQAYRYFLPPIFIWETLLPLFLFSLLSQVRFDLKETSFMRQYGRNFANTLVVVILVGIPAAIFLQNLWVHLFINTAFCQ